MYAYFVRCCNIWQSYSPLILRVATLCRKAASTLAQPVSEICHLGGNSFIGGKLLTLVLLYNRVSGNVKITESECIEKQITESVFTEITSLWQL